MRILVTAFANRSVAAGLITRNSCSNSTSKGNIAWDATGRLDQVEGRSEGRTGTPPRPGVLSSSEASRGSHC